MYIDLENAIVDIDGITEVFKLNEKNPVMKIHKGDDEITIDYVLYDQLEENYDKLVKALCKGEQDDI